MKARIVNRVTIEGLLYQHSLEERVTGPNSKSPGTKYIRGSIDVATDNAKLNIVPVYFAYVTETTKSGKPNATYTTLKRIIDGELGCYTNPEVLDKAAKLHIDTSIGLNDYYTNRNGAVEHVSFPRCEGGFIHVVNSISESEKARSEFRADIVIVGAADKEEVVDDYGNVRTPHKVDVDGRIFGYKNAILPIHFSALNEGAMDYFLSLDASKKEPVFTQIKGQVVNQQLERKISTPSAFGEPDVRVVPYTNRDLVITWCLQEPYVFGEDITTEELKKLGQERENYLATQRSRYESNQESKGSAFAASTPAVPKDDGDNYDF